MVAPVSNDKMVLRREYKVPPSVVFDAWTHPDQMTQWFAPSDDYHNPFIEVDLKEGGEYRIGFLNTEGHRAVVGGKYLTVEPSSKLVFTWKWESPHEFEEHETLVTVEFHSVGSGTELVLTHERFPLEEMFAQHNAGWAGTLERLARAVNPL